MKKGIIVLSILCTSLLLFNPVKNMSFANKYDNSANSVKVYENNENDIDDKEFHNKNNTVNKNENIDQEDKYEDNKFEEDKLEYINKEEKIKQELIVNENKEIIKEKYEDNTYKEEQSLSKEQAKQLLININPELEYLYQGDENNFQVLKEKNLTGYVFLPNVDGDIGYFVDKTNLNIYYFHPSGYLELVK